MLNTRFAILSVAGAIALFFGMLICMELGRRYGLPQAKRTGESSRAGIGAVDAAVYSLLALLIGFVFSGAAGRFDKRREMVTHQVNAISTVWDRIDLLAPTQQPAVRSHLRTYVDALSEAYDHPAGSRRERSARRELDDARGLLWSDVIRFSLTPEGEKARVLIIPSVNELFDATDQEEMAQHIHPPTFIYAMLVLIALATSVFAGYSMSAALKRNWLIMAGAAGSIAVALFVSLELESPRVGWIRIDSMNVLLAQVRADMTSPVTPSAALR